MHHDLDIHPIPEKVPYINELGIADTAFYYNTEEHVLMVGFYLMIIVRVYALLDLNATQILNNYSKSTRLWKVRMIRLN